MTALAIRCAGVRKSYRLYASPLDMVLDRLGLGALVRWRRGSSIREFEALRGIDLELRRGERIGIIGRNGAGKTTLLKLLVGAATQNLQPDSGVIEVSGSIQPLLQVGGGFHPELTGLANARATLLQNGLYGAVLKSALDDVAEFTELGDYLERPVKTYSLGMGMRLQFAVATAVSPDILIVDEVLGAGDAYFLAKSAERMRRLAFSGCTLLLVSHSAEQILQYCDRAIWLRDGVVAMDGAAGTVVAAYNSFSNALAESAAAAVADPAVQQFRPFAPEIPDHAQTAFIDGLLTRSEGVDGQPCQVVTFPSGRHARRYAGRSGARISDIRVSAFSGVSNLLHVGDPIRIELDIDLDPSMVTDIRCILDLYTLEAERVTSLSSPQLRPAGKDGRIRAVLEIALPLMGAREYLGTVSLVEGQGMSAVVHEVLSQAIYLPITNTNDAGPPLMHHSGNWYFGDAGTPVPARISSVQ